MIGDDVSIVIKALHGNQVQLAVCAPEKVPVHRLEVYNRIKQEQGYVGLLLSEKLTKSDKDPCWEGRR